VTADRAPGVHMSEMTVLEMERLYRGSEERRVVPTNWPSPQRRSSTKKSHVVDSQLQM
jgi:hypothetical protein